MNRKILLILMLTMMLLTQASAQTTEQEEAMGHFTYCPYVAVFYSLYSASDESTGGNKNRGDGSLIIFSTKKS